MLAGCAGRDPDDDERAARNPAFFVPRITPSDELFVVSHASVPVVDATAWRLSIDGLVAAGGAALSLSLTDVEAAGLVDKELTLQCIGASPRNRAIGNAVWSVVSLRALLDAAGATVDDDARFVHVRSADGYLSQLDRSDVDGDRVLVATRMNGAPLSPAHGAPARLLVVGRYGFKSPKWIEQLTFATDAVVGTWQELGYPDDGSNRPAAFVELPTSAQHVAQAPLDLVGSAFCGDVPITSVELSSDGGASWQSAELLVSGVPDVWTLWRFPFTPPAPGEHVFLVRVRAADGRGSLAENPEDNAGWQGYGRVAFVVD